MKPMPSPFSLGYRMPAEWERHEATWLSWPKDPLTFPARILPEVEQTYVKIIESLSDGERVDLLVDDQSIEEKVSSLLTDTSNVVFHQVKSADVWIRDYGPIFVKNEDVACTKWIFNAWGNKYEELKPDNETGLRVAKLSGKRIHEQPMILEGGSIDVNGLGTCLTTKQCLLNKNRNPNLDQKRIEKNLQQGLGVTKVIWLDSGIAGDDTDGHVDDVARFVSKDTVVCMVERDLGEENYEALKRDLEILEGARDQSGGRLRTVPIQMPRRIDSNEGRIPASYANFYIGNSSVLVPTFDDPNDEIALETLKRLFLERRIVGVDCSRLAYGLGTIHCVTQQQPALV
jgi:agmatine deiminase